jgi:hypothetical protein
MAHRIDEDEELAGAEGAALEILRLIERLAKSGDRSGAVRELGEAYALMRPSEDPEGHLSYDEAAAMRAIIEGIRGFAATKGEVIDTAAIAESVLAYATAYAAIVGNETPKPSL